MRHYRLLLPAPAAFLAPVTAYCCLRLLPIATATACARYLPGGARNVPAMFLDDTTTKRLPSFQHQHSGLTNRTPTQDLHSRCLHPHSRFQDPHSGLHSCQEPHSGHPFRTPAHAVVGRSCNTPRRRNCYFPAPVTLRNATSETT